MSIFYTFIRQQPALKRFVSRFLLSASHDIDDVLQETFIRAFDAEKKTSISEPKAFLFRIAKNIILSELDKKAHKVTDYIDDNEASEGLTSDVLVENDVIAQKRLGVFCEVVSGLPAQCRKVFLMKRVYGFSQKEIALELGIAESTVEKHIIKAMRLCSQMLKERYGDNSMGDMYAYKTARNSQAGRKNSG